MKRLYILGNGFDVAHKLPTAYLDYRKFLKGSIENTDFCIRMEDTYGLGENTDYWWKEFETMAESVIDTMILRINQRYISNLWNTITVLQASKSNQGR